MVSRPLLIASDSRYVLSSGISNSGGITSSGDIASSTNADVKRMAVEKITFSFTNFLIFFKN